MYQSEVKVPNQYQSIVRCFTQLLKLPSQERPLFILLDGIDHLSKEDGPAGLSWLPGKLPKHVKIILSTVQDVKFQVYPVLCSMYGSTSTNLVEVHMYIIIIGIIIHCMYVTFYNCTYVHTY